MSKLVAIEKDGQTVYVSEEAAAAMGKESTDINRASKALFADGETFSPGDAPVSGETTEVTTADMGARITQGVEDAEFTGNELRAGVGSFLNTATLGATDVIAKHVLGVNMEQEDKLRAQNPTGTITGTVLGVVPSLMTGGSGAAGAIARATPIGRLTMASERVAQGIGGIKGMAAAGAIENASMAAMQTISDMSVGRKDFSAEALVSGIGYNAILGGALGGGLGVVAKGAQKGLAKLSKADEVSGITGDFTPLLAQKLDDGKFAVPEVAEKGVQAIKANQALKMQKQAQKVMADAMDAVSDAKTVDLAISRKVIQDYDNFLGKVDIHNMLGSQALEADGFISRRLGNAEAVDALIASGSYEAAHAAFSRAYGKTKFFNTAKRALDKGDIAGFKEALDAQKKAADLFKTRYPKAAALVDDLPTPTDLIEKLDPNSSVKYLAQKVRENPLWAARTEDELNLAINSIAEFKAAAGTVAGSNEVFDKAIKKLDDSLAKFDIDGGFKGLDDVDALKDRFAMAWSRERMMQGAASQPGVARKAWDKLKDNGNGNFMVGAMLGGGLDGAMGALGLGVLMKSDTVKAILSTGAKMATKAAAKLDAPIVRRAAIANISSKPAERKKYVKDEFDRLSHAANSQEYVAENLRNNLPELFVSPQMMSTALTRASTAANYLLSKLPQLPEDNTPFGLGSKYVPSDAEMAEYQHAKAVAENPMSVVGKLADGKISPAEGEAFRELWPELHSELVSGIIQHLEEARDLPYQKQMALSLLLGVPVASVLQPAVVAALQATYAPQDMQQQGGPDSGTSARGENTATKAQTLAK